MVKRTGSDRARFGRINKPAGLILLLALLLVVPTSAFAEAVTAVETKDTNVDGHLDQLAVTFDQAPAVADLVPANFLVAGYQVASVTADPSNSALIRVDLTPKSEFDTGATPAVTYKGTQALGTVDKAKPVLIGASGDDQGSSTVFNAVGDAVSFKFSEPISLLVAGAAPATTSTDENIALEEAIRIGGPPSGCGTDGSGTPLGTRNFPVVSAGVTTDVGADVDPYTVVGDTIVVTQKQGNDGSTVGGGSGSLTANGRFTINPAAASAFCTAGINAQGQKDVNIRDVANNASAHPAAGAVSIQHVRGYLPESPITADTNLNGQIDEVTLTFNQAVDSDSVTRALTANRLAISGGGESATGLSFSPVVGNAKQIKVSFTPPAGWNTGTTPRVDYDGAGDCLGTGILVTLANPAFKECTDTFSKLAEDKAAPVLVGAKTRDLTHPVDLATEAGANGRIDTLELAFSEAVEDDTFSPTGDGWTVAGYTVNALNTGDAADDAIVRLTFSELATPDTGAKPAVSYSAPAAPQVADLRANKLGPIVNQASLDGAGPALIAGTIYDVMAGGAAGNDGRVDEALVTFSEPVVDATRIAAKFSIGNIAATAVKDTPLNADDAKVADDSSFTVAVGAGVLGTEAKDLGTLAGAAGDAAGNGASALALASTTVADKAKPVVLAVSPLGQAEAAKDLTITWSESMNKDVAPTLKFGEAEPYEDVTVPASTVEGHTNGYRDGDTTKWDGTAPGGASCAVPTGCLNHFSIRGAQGADGNGMAIEPDTHLTWTIDVMAPSMPSISSPVQNGSIGTPGGTSNVTISGVASEPGLEIQVVVDASETPQTTTSNATSEGIRWSISVPLGLGAHTATVRAIDAGGNASPTSTVRSFSVKQITSITAIRNTSMVVYGQTATISGQLKNASGAPISGGYLVLQQKPYGWGSWGNLTTRRTDSQGRYSIGVRPVRLTDYRVVYTGSSTLMPATSGTARVLVRSLVSISRSASSIAYGRTVTLKGTVSPNHKYKYVYLQQYTSSGWRNISTLRLSSTSTYTFIVKPASRGTIKYRVYFPGEADHVYNYSAVTAVKVI